MANLKIKATFSGPEEIDIPLVRADIHFFSNIFRTLFEVCLAVFSSLIGVISSTDNIDTLHWVFLSVMGVLSVTFLLMSYYLPNLKYANKYKNS
jgi:RsiW-degrading membrane proteinase PrsW (M82 family)